MRSPFPGMDPYIEARGLWPDFHNHLIEKIGETLADAAPERYFVRTGVRSYTVLIKSEEKSNHPFIPDVTVTTPRRGKKGPRNGGLAVAEPPGELEPLTLRAFVDEEFKEAFVEIYESEPEQRLVTCIEVLSPSNKQPGSEGWDLYQRKRQSFLLGEANLVEIDLLRGGKRMPMLDPWPKCPFVLMAVRARNYQLCKVWPGYYQTPLPTIQVPLAKPDAPLPLSLQPLVDSIYQRYRYAQTIDYSKPLSPPLGGEEITWLQGQLRKRAKKA